MSSVRALSNTILKRSFEEAIPVSPMDLQKLLYYIYRDHYKNKDKRIFSERFLARPSGPVLSSVYDDFKSFGEGRITRFAKDANGNVYVLSENKSDHSIVRIVDDIWNMYKYCSAAALPDITQIPGSAWEKAYYSGQECLDDEDIKNERIAAWCYKFEGSA